MCQNARATAASLMAAIEPTLKSLLTYTGTLNTTAGQAVITAYDAALAAVTNWKQGNAAEETLQVINAFQQAFSELPLPAPVETLGNIILAGIETVIGVVSANSPAPQATEAVSGTAEPQAMHQAMVAHDTVKKVHALVPTIKLSRFHSADAQYKTAWNDAVVQNGLPETLKAA